MLISCECGWTYKTSAKHMDALFLQHYKTSEIDHLKPKRNKPDIEFIEQLSSDGGSSAV